MTSIFDSRHQPNELPFERFEMMCIAFKAEIDLLITSVAIAIIV
jgi:hypothetical protein